MTIKKTRVAILVFTCLLFSACGGKKETISEEPVVDITRPPQTVKDAAKPAQEEETNPDETISYDEWRRRREQEAKGETP